jgi:hypothetical protein
MGGVELGVRYRAGKGGALVTVASGTVVQLAPFASIRFVQQPLKIKGQLLRAGRRGEALYEAPAFEPPEVKA